MPYPFNERNEETEKDWHESQSQPEPEEPLEDEPGNDDELHDDMPMTSERIFKTRVSQEQERPAVPKSAALKKLSFPKRKPAVKVDPSVYDTTFEDLPETPETTSDANEEAPFASSPKKAPFGQPKRLRRVDSGFQSLTGSRRLRVIRSSHTGCFGWMFGFVGLFVRIFIVTGIIVAICAWIGWQMASSYIDTPEVPVPNIRGLRIDTALSVVSENGMSIMKERNEPSVLVAPGEIIDQKPGPGTRARKGAIIRVVISGDNEERQKVPDVVGSSKEDAIAMLKGANLEIGEINMVNDAARPEGTIISQTPEAGQLITDQVKKVDLLVSRGK